MPPEVAELAADPNVLAIVVDDPPLDGAQTDMGNDDLDEPQSSEEAVKVATLMGWKPKDQWKGDVSGWRPAEEFLAEVPEILSRTRQRANKTQQQLDKVAGLVAKLTATQRRDMDARHEAALDAAVEAGDTEGAKRILAEIRQTSTQASDDPPALAAFKVRNEWFEVDPEATAYAIALDGQLAKGGISDPDKHMERVETAVKKRFPELFEADTDAPKAKEEKLRPRAPLIGAGGRTAPPRRANGELTVGDLTPSQRRAAEEMDVSLTDYAAAVNRMNKQAAA